MEGGGTPGEARAAAPCQEPAEETLGGGVLGRRSATPLHEAQNERTEGRPRLTERNGAADGMERRGGIARTRSEGGGRGGRQNSPDLSGAFGWGSWGLC